jgi:hypothetical protein
MYPIVLNGIKQHEIINGYNNCSKNDKACCEFHKHIFLSIQKEVNFEADLLPNSTGIIEALNKIIKAFENPIEIEIIKTRWEEIKKLQNGNLHFEIF